MLLLLARRLPRVGHGQVRLVSRHVGVERTEPEFGILFDIDGVLVRGKKVLPFAPSAFERLVNSDGKFRVPTVFVTNAGNSLRQSKADQLSNWLGVEVTEDQVVMSHSPLKMFKEYHSKHVLVTGQGPIGDIANNLGFKHVTTMKQFRHSFPSLDAVDHKRRRAAPCAFETYFPQIEAIVLFGEPIRWETSLQLLIDALMSDGLPAREPSSIPYPHLPVMACNMDLQWMAEAVMPRFGHGAFLLCLENLYKKATGRELVYSALIGKPSEITYRHSEHVLQEQAQKLGMARPLKHIYCIGDNICTDIFGANLYNRYLQKRREEDSAAASVYMHSGSSSRSIDHLVGAEDELHGAQHCFSVLVETGVYTGENDRHVSLNHSPRDFLPAEESYQQPTFVVPHVLEAVNLIFQKEKFS